MLCLNTFVLPLSLLNPSLSLTLRPTGVIGEASLVCDSLSMENTAKTISTHKNKKTKKKKSKPTKEVSHEYISQEAPSQICQHGGVAVSYQPPNEIDGHKYVRDKNMRSDSAALTSVCASQMHEFSDDPSVQNCKEHPEVFVLARNLLQTEVGNCSSNQTSPCCNENRSKQGTEVVRNGCFTSDRQDNHSSKLFDCKPYNFSTANGKENRTFICKRNHNNAMGAKRSNVDNIEKIINLPDKSLGVKHDKISSEGPLSTPSVFSYEHTNTGFRDRKVGNKEPFMYTRIQNRGFAESSQWDDKQRLSGRVSQYGTWSNSSKHGNYSNVRKEQEVCELNFIGLFEHDELQKVPFPFGSRHFKKSNFARTSMCNKHQAVSPSSLSHEQRNVPPYARDCGLLNGFRTYDWERIPRFRHEFERSSHYSSGSEPWSEFHLRNFRQGYHTGASEMKWIPVAAARGSSVLKWTNSGCDSDDKASVTREAGKGSHLHASMAPLPKSLSVLSSESECSTACHKMASSKSKPPSQEGMVGSSNDSVKCGDKTNKTQQFVIGSPKAMEALNAAYKLQLESDSFQLAVKSPLAEIERFLHSAAPVISPSYTLCSSKWLTHDRLCKHQIPNLSIRSIWEWYEEAGNYGLDVSAEFPESMPFHAYFVPSLSAIQLFYPRSYSHCSKIGVHVEPDSSSNLVDFPSLLEELYSPKPASSSSIPTCNCRDSTGMDPSPACCIDSELVFEFFESEQPQDRKPLHLKVAELLNGGSNNSEFFGDPSKLESSNLRDLHPASWFAVAWYPIYRIPEGKMRASFLTYHSLGFWTERCNGTNDMKCSVVAPVLGLENYNAHDERWFEPKLKLQNYSVGVLKERVRTLEENASHFARGCVCKGKANRQPDYEFFVGRKRPLTW